MPHISNKKLEPVYLKKLEHELIRSFERSFADLKTKSVFHEFFTKTEKIMFAKRLAVIAMLKKGVSPYMIAESLHMSPSTTERMSNNYEKGNYNKITNLALGKKDIWNIIESILTLKGIMPPKHGKGRWRSLDKRTYKDNLKNS